MRQAGLRGVSQGQRKIRTTQPGSGNCAADLVRHHFTARPPDQLWVADLTYIRTWAGWVARLSWMDSYSRSNFGWQTTTPRRASLVVDAMERGTSHRLRWARPKQADHHLRPGQPTSSPFGTLAASLKTGSLPRWAAEATASQQCPRRVKHRSLEEEFVHHPGPGVPQTTLFRAARALCADAAVRSRIEGSPAAATPSPPVTTDGSDGLNPRRSCSPPVRRGPCCSFRGKGLLRPGPLSVSHGGLLLLL